MRNTVGFNLYVKSKKSKQNKTGAVSQVQEKNYRLPEGR